MNRKLTITVSEELYAGLHRKVGRRHISRFLEKLARPHVIGDDMDIAYREMAAEREREDEALEWSEALIPDASR
jgi:hypothetical protein